jgi:hypothetical protein
MKNVKDIITMVLAAPFVVLLWAVGILAYILTYIINGILGEETVTIERSEEEEG